MGGTKPYYVIVGAFVLLMLAALLYSLVRLSGWIAETASYETAFTNVAGVTRGTKVFYEGYAIGSVADVEWIRPAAEASAADGDGPGGTCFRVVLEIEKDWRIAKTAIAEIASPGFLSARVVKIFEPDSEYEARRGLSPCTDDRDSSEEDAASRFLEPGQTIPGRELSDLDEVIRSVGDAADDLIARLTGVVDQAGLLLREENVAHVNRTLANVDAFSGELIDLSGKAGALVENANTLIEEARGYTSPANREQVERLLVQLNADLDRLSGNANRLVDEARSLIADNRPSLDDGLADFRYVMDALARDIDTINRNLEGTSRNMYEFSRQIRQNPGVLLGGTSPGSRR